MKKISEAIYHIENFCRLWKASVEGLGSNEFREGELAALKIILFQIDLFEHGSCFSENTAADFLKALKEICRLSNLCYEENEDRGKGRGMVFVRVESLIEYEMQKERMEA